MTTNETLAAAPRPTSFLNSTWSTPSLVVGLLLLGVYRLVAAIDPTWRESIPSWVVIVFVGIVPYTIMLVYPLVVRRQDSPARIEWPSFKNIAVESAWAALVIIGVYVVVGALVLVLELFSPGTTITPDGVDSFGNSMPTAYVYGFLFAISTIAPVAEEFFCRGFLFNAFRQRMPLLIAVVISSLIFGFAHSMGLVHSIFASFLGVVLALIYCWRQTILTPILVHVGINTLFSVAMMVSMQVYSESPAIGVFPQEGVEECVIDNIQPGSPAELAGLEPGDNIIQFGEYGVYNFQHLVDAIAMYQPGDSVDVIFLRDGMSFQTTLELLSRREMLEQ